ncbi:MAG TPA: type II toxin-antitoxin system VapB family antitoxin [Tepidisphaeraceae bacterium]|nr:type II toxin-antitoxin system VapB family antitoxin [Tepidisphaeraceae bacterium]
MNTTIDIPDEVLRRTILASGMTNAQEAILKALQEFVSRHDQRSVIPLLGTFEDFMTPEELDEMRSSE